MRISDWSSDVCSSDLLANFPSEADLVPGARPIEDREREILARKVLGEMLEEAEGHKDRQVLDAVAQFTCRTAPQALRVWLMRCANARESRFGLLSEERRAGKECVSPGSSRSRPYH